MQGQLSEHPLPELIREVSAAKQSGALRLTRERVKAAVYFENGALIFAGSNLRAHRLLESLQRHPILTESQLAQLPQKASDEELADLLVQNGTLTSETLATIRARQVSDVLRGVLLWTDGAWELDPRVRLGSEMRVTLDVGRLLLECARRLPVEFITSRFDGTNGTFLRTTNDSLSEHLLPAEALVLSRAEAPLALEELAAVSGLRKDEALRAIYALSVSGLLQRSDQPSTSPSSLPAHAAAPEPSVPAAEEIDEISDLQELFARLERVTDHYEVLNVKRMASAEEIKNAYHTLALRYHPDRFHQSEPAFRSRVDSAFARIAQAYEILGDVSARAAYDARRTPRSSRTSASKTAWQSTSRGSEMSRAESSFQRGRAALQQNRSEEAIRFLAEAAMLEPREARYRAHYGHALIGQTHMRRVAESELQKAVSLEPDNTAYRVMLAELYKALGLSRRAEGELQRALAADPRNEAARVLLASLKNKG